MKLRNCHFKFECGQKWESFATTASSSIRHCSTCDEDVHLCTTDTEIARALRRNWCVAIPNKLFAKDDARELKELKEWEEAEGMDGFHVGNLPRPEDWDRK